METEEVFFEKLREEAKALRWDADEATLARVASRVRRRTRTTVFDALSRWFVPVAAALIILITASIIASATLFGPSTSDLVATLDPPHFVQEDYYRVIH